MLTAANKQQSKQLCTKDFFLNYTIPLKLRITPESNSLTQMRIDTQPWVLMGPYKLC